MKLKKDNVSEEVANCPIHKAMEIFQGKWNAWVAIPTEASFFTISFPMFIIDVNSAMFTSCIIPITTSFYPPNSDFPLSPDSLFPLPIIAEKGCFSNQNRSISACVLSSQYRCPSFTCSVYISLINPIDSSSVSAMDIPNCTHRSRNSGVVISRSVG